MDKWKSRGGNSQRRGEEERRSGKRKSEKKEDADARKGRKVAIHCVSPMICGWEPSGSPGHFLEASGSFRGPLGASELFRRFCWTLLRLLKASGSLWQLVGASGSFLGASGSLLVEK